MMTQLFFVLVLASFPVVLAAETVYVGDTDHALLRSGPSIEHQILDRGLKSGTKLERLETDDETNHSRVRTEAGLEGWVASQYLVTSPIARVQPADTEPHLEELDIEHLQTRLRLDEAVEQANKAKEHNVTLSEELNRVTRLSTDVIRIEEQNKQLTEEQTSLLGEVEALNRRNEELRDARARDWFLGGAATILTGLVIGILIGRRLPKHKPSSWT